MISYAGIGSRETPPPVLEFMARVGEQLGRAGITLRSGAAEGADTAFEIGAVRGGGPTEIFLPWPRFNGRTYPVIPLSAAALQLAQQFHPAWGRLSPAAQKLMARNCYQVLGADLAQPADFILCYTRNGTGAGGTGQALRIGQSRQIPIFDFGAPTHLMQPWADLAEFLRPWIALG